MADLAAFDFDGTLTEGGSVFGFLSALAGPAKVVRATAALAPRLGYAALAGGSAADQTTELLFRRVLAGMPTERVDRTAVVYAEAHLAKRVRPTVKQRLDWHRHRGDWVVIVSASPEAYVRVAGDRLGANHVIATRLEVTEDGTLSGYYQGANCRGDEKLRRLRLWIEESAIAPEAMWSYGNSRGDLG